MSQASEQKIVKIDAALESLQRERRRCTDPADILRVSESIDVRLDERLRLMRNGDGANGGDHRSSGDHRSTGRGRRRRDSH